MHTMRCRWGRCSQRRRDSNGRAHREALTYDVRRYDRRSILVFELALAPDPRRTHPSLLDIHSPLVAETTREDQRAQRILGATSNAGADVGAASSASKPLNGRRNSTTKKNGRHQKELKGSGKTLISIGIWPDAASAENALRDGLATWENDPDQLEAPVVF
jgi:hypothetical protein